MSLLLVLLAGGAVVFAMVALLDGAPLRHYAAAFAIVCTFVYLQGAYSYDEGHRDGVRDVCATLDIDC